MKIGIIGGSGVYDPKLLTDTKQITGNTPFGATSDLLTIGKFEGVDVVIIPRHGSNHTINPTNVNYRANIWAMKEQGVTHIISTGAVGSLRKSFKPGELVFTDQFIDRTTKRKSTFFDKDQVAHVGVADPTCPEIRQLLSEEAKKLGFSFHNKGTNVTIEGPRFSTKAESKMFQAWGGDTIGMTMVPECVLAREAEICYATIGMVTDYDVWKEGNEVSFEDIIQTMKENEEKVKKLLSVAIPKIARLSRKCSCKDALKGAIV